MVGNDACIAEYIRLGKIIAGMIYLQCYYREHVLSNLEVLKLGLGNNMVGKIIAAEIIQQQQTATCTHSLKPHLHKTWIRIRI